MRGWYDWEGIIPKKSEKLQRFLDKAASGQPVTVLFYGDSITTGCNSSKMVNVPPYAPCWYEMVIDTMKKHFGNPNIRYVNTAVGGKNSDWALEELQKEGITKEEIREAAEYVMERVNNEGVQGHGNKIVHKLHTGVHPMIKSLPVRFLQLLQVVTHCRSSKILITWLMVTHGISADSFIRLVLILSRMWFSPFRKHSSMILGSALEGPGISGLKVTS